MTCMSIDAQDRKNQIALNADDIIPSLFSSDANSYNILYRRKVKEKKYFRLGLKYLQESKNQFLFGIKPGLDYAFSINTKWVFYYGFDLALVYQDNLQSERKYYESTIIPFFRAEYIISDSFSISTEPGLFFRLIQVCLKRNACYTCLANLSQPCFGSSLLKAIGFSRAIAPSG